MSYMRYSVNFQRTRVSGFLFSSHMGGLQMAIYTPFFSLKIARVYSIVYTIIIAHEIEVPILLQGLGFALLMIFLGGGGLQIIMNVLGVSQ